MRTNNSGPQSRGPLLLRLRRKNQWCDIFKNFVIASNKDRKEALRVPEEEKRQPDWKKIKTEYITGDASYRDLAKKYDVPFRTLSDRAKREKWVDRRSKHRDSVVSKSVRRKAKAQVESITRLKTSVDKMVKVMDQASEADFYLGVDDVRDKKGNPVYDVVDGKYIPRQVKVVDAKGFRAMVAAMRDLTEVVRNLYDVPTRAEQISLEMAQQRLELEKAKAAKGDEANHIVVELLGDDTEEYIG